MLKAVLLDLDDTLLDDKSTMERVYQDTADYTREIGLEVPMGRLWREYQVASLEAWSKLNRDPRSESTPDALRAWSWQLALDRCDAGDSHLAAQLARFHCEARRAAYRLYPDTLPTLHLLRSNCRLVIVTNGPTELQREKVMATRLHEWVDAVLISQECGVSKPDPAIFHKALAAAGSDARHSVMAGDSPANDVGGALAAGVRPVWVNRRQIPWPGPGAPPAHAISDLRSLPDIAAGL